jgi:PIN domain nuclease of toxin-antitoxin system
LLVAQTMAEGLTLMTADATVAAYSESIFRI